MARARVVKLRKIAAGFYQGRIEGARRCAGGGDPAYCNLHRTPTGRWSADIRISINGRGRLVRDCGDWFRTRREAIDEVEIMA